MAWLGGEPVGCLLGSSVILEARGRGGDQGLLGARLRRLDERIVSWETVTVDASIDALICIQMRFFAVCSRSIYSSRPADMRHLVACSKLFIPRSGFGILCSCR